MKLKESYSREDINFTKYEFENKFEDFLKYRENNHYLNNKKPKLKKTLKINNTNINIIKGISATIFYGEILTGLSGEKGEVIDDKSGDPLYTMDENHAKLSPIFFYLKIPKNRNFAYLVLERKGNYGIKELFGESINDYLNKIDKNTKLAINNFLVAKVFEKIISMGVVKEMEFIRHELPNELSELYDVPHKTNQMRGKVKRSYTSATGFPVKNLLTRLFNYSGYSEMIEIPEMNEKFDEVSFELEYNGSKKTFFMKHIGQNAPDYNVTDSLKYNMDGRPTITSILFQTEILIHDMEAYYESITKGKNA